MFGYGRNSGISWFRDYDDALHKFENTDNIRGRTVEPMKPLGNRRSVDMYSIRMRDDGAIECVLYKTPVVTFLQDDTIEIRNDGWASQSTSNFISEVLGSSVQVRVFNDAICIRSRGKEHRLPQNGALIFKKPTTEYAWECLNPQTSFVHQVNRKRTNNVRLRYKEFANYLVGVGKLRAGSNVSAEEMENVFGKHDDGRVKYLSLNRTSYTEFPMAMNKFMQLISATGEDKHEKFYHAFLMLCHSFGSWDYRSNSMATTTDKLVNGLDWVLKGAHRDEVFDVVEVEAGLVRRDAYGVYYLMGWNQYHLSFNADAQKT